MFRLFARNVPPRARTSAAAHATFCDRSAFVAASAPGRPVAREPGPGDEAAGALCPSRLRLVASPRSDATSSGSWAWMAPPACTRRTR